MPVGGGEETRVGNWAACSFWQHGVYFETPPDKQGRIDFSVYDFSTRETKKILTMESPAQCCALPRRPDDSLHTG